MIPWLKLPADFPAVETALPEPNGLLCAGGDLAPASILKAYSRGIFPWYSEGQPILWWSPDPRMVLFPDEFKVSKSLAKTARSGKLDIRFDSPFADVMTGCAAPRTLHASTWIVEAMQAAYTPLHQLGFKPSLDSPRNAALFGAVYGIALGRI